MKFSSTRKSMLLYSVWKLVACFSLFQIMPTFTITTVRINHLLTLLPKWTLRTNILPKGLQVLFKFFWCWVSDGYLVFILTLWIYLPSMLRNMYGPAPVRTCSSHTSLLHPSRKLQILSVSSLKFYSTTTPKMNSLYFKSPHSFWKWNWDFHSLALAVGTSYSLILFHSQQRKMDHYVMLREQLHEGKLAAECNKNTRESASLRKRIAHIPFSWLLKSLSCFGLLCPSIFFHSPITALHLDLKSKIAPI